MALIETEHLLLDPAAVATAPDDEVGGKARGLARLDQLAATTGATVPAFRVLPASVFRAQLRDPDVRAAMGEVLIELADIELDDTDALGRIGACSKPLVTAVADAEVPSVVRDAIGAALAELGPGPWSVRSSMVGEDGAAQSFAGQLESFLYLPEAASVIDAVRGCWASAFSPRALVYAHRAAMSPASARVAVVIQRMIDADVAGVVFTANPTTGDRDEVLITAAWGQGEGVVSGLCDTDEYVYVVGEGERRSTVADKDQLVTRSPSGLGTVTVPTDPTRRRVRALSEAQVVELGAAAVAVADALGSPQDLEFAVEGSTLHLLQTRPITALPVPTSTSGRTALWDNSNIQESYCGVTTPLTFSMASRGYGIVYETFFRVAGTPESVLRDHRDLFANLLGLLDGRVYYRLDNWYLGCLLLPSPTHTKDDMEKMMGVDEPVDFVTDQDESVGDKLAAAAKLLPVAAKLVPQLATIDRRIAGFHAHFREVEDSVDREALPTMTFSELMDMIRMLDHELLERWDVPILNDLRVLRASGALRRSLMQTLDAGADDPEVVRLSSELLAGIDGIESVEPTRLLLRMAAAAREDAALSAALTDGDPASVLVVLRDRHPVFAARIDEYVHRYGDRVMGELKLETVSLREDPGFVISVLRNYLTRPDLDADTLTRRENEHYQSALTSVLDRLKPRQQKAFAKKVIACREAVKAREALRLERTRLFGLYRDIYRAIGSRLAEAGRLDGPRDVFWLTIEEIRAYDDGRSVTKDLAALARLRKAEFDGYEGTELPHRLETIGPVYHGNTLTRPDPAPEDLLVDALTGTGCYPGVVQSEVRVVHSPEDELSVNGRILVTVRTDPGWAPLFPTCSGLLVERGSTLSHSAVVARELGIPAIVGIKGLTQIVQDREEVRMDGAAGSVVRLDRADVAYPDTLDHTVDDALDLRDAGAGIAADEGAPR